MRNSATIELIGYVGQDPKTPKPEDYPSFVTFQVGVTRTWKDSKGNEQKENNWFNCQTNTEAMASIVKAHVRQGAGILVKGYPKVSSFTDKSGKANAVIEVKITELNILTYPKNKEAERDDNSSSSLTHKQQEINSFNDDEIPF